MGLVKRIIQWGLGRKQPHQSKSRHGNDVLRRCQFEVMEPRQVLSVNPVVVGITYHEGDIGQDTTPDQFEVTYQGGSPTTMLTQIVINGDQDRNGIVSDGDMIFDHSAGGPGTGGFHNFLFDAAKSSGLNASDIQSYSVSPDGMKLTLNVRNFQAGDKLAFTIDVDEVESPFLDKIASGVEFEGTIFVATFVDPHFTFASRDVSVNAHLENDFVQNQVEGVFYDHYDDLFAEGSSVAGASLALPLDNHGGQADRSAGAIDAYNLTPKNVTISGHVFEDPELCCDPDSTVEGIANVKLTLQKFNSSTQKYETVAQTTTNANGFYQFGENLNLKPGIYRVIEAQPNGYLDVSASVGKVAGVKTGNVVDDNAGQPNIIANINIPLGGTAATDYDFLEVKPISLSGKVWHDRNDDGQIQNGEEGIANVLIRITRTGSADTVNPDPFAGQAQPIFVKTAADGSYSVDGLPPGLYEIVEINNYPPTNNPLAGFIDGKDAVGKINGTTVGTGGNDSVNQIKICPGDSGIGYNFGELKPTSIGGYVSIASPEGNCLEPDDPNFTGLAGVTVKLFDVSGNLVATTTTNANGLYQFNNLRNGTYTIVEVQPNGYLDGEEDVGTVNGVTTGSSPANDRFSGIVLSSGQAATQYNFCEHRPAQIQGTVWHDRNDNGVLESGEQRIGGVLIELYDANGNKIAQTQTDATGAYSFDNLYAGAYTVRESQPATFVDGKDSLGTIGGSKVGQQLNDEFRNINILEGQTGINYNFGEIKFASISGMVHADVDGDCEYNGAVGDRLLSDVTVILLNDQGAEVGRTTTNAQGQYVFSNLRPGTYTVREIGPSGYLDGGEFAGTVGGESRGSVTDDQINAIAIASGDQAVNYNFCEHVPAEICGYVYHDRNNNGLRDANEEGIGNTLVQLFDMDGSLVAETTTDANGEYCFTNLLAGEYCVKENQPTGFVDGKDAVGKVEGTRIGQLENDELCQITILGGQHGTDYNFGELKLAKISGYVLVDKNGNCMFEASAGDLPIANVRLELLDSTGAVIASTKTAADGSYSFNSLLPGTYSIRQTQPTNYFDVDQMVGMTESGAEGTGDASGVNIIGNIQISSGQVLVQYNFCEDLPAQINGRVWEDGPTFHTEDGNVPSDYRQQRDGVYQSGVDTALAGVRMQLYYYIDPTTSEIAPRPVTLKDVLPGSYPHVGNNPDAAIWVLTDANGEYHFTGLRAGNYIVLQQQPGGYVDANDVVGSTTGFTFNSQLDAAVAPKVLLDQFSVNQIMDSIANIHVNAGGISVQNNFTEVRAVEVPRNPFLTPIPPSPLGFGGPRPDLPGAFIPGLGGMGAFNPFAGLNRPIVLNVSSGGNDTPHTWHLSVVNAGAPRAVGESDSAQTNWLQAAFIRSDDWNRFDMDQAHWSFSTLQLGELQKLDRVVQFGMIDGIPVAGDFDGDGTDEVAVYKEGYWMIDLNRNGLWDQDDLLARLGDSDDQPVIGDWDGDGKEDIGIYGPMWEGDPEAIAQDPGLPNPDNMAYTNPKNIPPTPEESTSGARAMKLTSFGRQRTDLVDHVFGIDDYRRVAVTGDWNGNGIRSIATFDAGSWRLDLNGDGRFDHQDSFAVFGAEGDVPIVGDFNGDGIEEIAVYRAGMWIIDSNGNRQMDPDDQRFEYGSTADKPVVGDWNGDGTDDIGLYQAPNGTN